MTVGQRIAQKRKELGLSQEGLGERLGVSRQAIYKWEADAALPEVEKLVNLSREFSVPVGWLLGEEDGRPELTAEQLRMVEEIVGRYLDARPPEKAIPLRETVEPEEEDGEEPEERPKRRRWPWVLAGVAAVIAAMVFVDLFSRLDRLSQNYQSLQMSISNINSDVNQQIYSITQRVEETLQRQNSLMAEQGAQVSDTDYRANTVTISVRALPRTYAEGMGAEFILDSGGETITAAGALGEDHAFTARLTGPLSDEITVSVVLLTGDQRQTQVLDQFTGLYSQSLPSVRMEHGQLWGSTERIPEYTWASLDGEPKGGAEIAELRVGLFRDWKLLAWYEPVEDAPPNWNGFDAERDRFFRLEGEWTMEPGYVYCIAAVVTDEYGREQVYNSFPVKYDDRDGHGGFYEYYSPDGTVSFSGDPADWEY